MLPEFKKKIKNHQYPRAGHRVRTAQNTAAPAIQDRQGLREHQRGDVANYIAASV